MLARLAAQISQGGGQGAIVIDDQCNVSTHVAHLELVMLTKVGQVM
jgi:hypothetical protein